MSNKLKLFILSSVVLNCILIGIVAGHSYHRYGMRHGHGGGISELLDKTSLPEEQRESLRKAFESATPHPKNRGMGRSQEEIISILTAEKFDEDAFRSKIEEKHQKLQARKEKMTNSIVDIASKLNQEERQELAKLLRRKKTGRLRIKGR